MTEVAEDDEQRVQCPWQLSSSSSSSLSSSPSLPSSFSSERRALGVLNGRGSHLVLNSRYLSRSQGPTAEEWFRDIDSTLVTSYRLTGVRPTLSPCLHLAPSRPFNSHPSLVRPPPLPSPCPHSSLEPLTGSKPGAWTRWRTASLRLKYRDRHISSPWLSRINGNLAERASLSLSLSLSFSLSLSLSLSFSLSLSLFLSFSLSLFLYSV